MTEAYSDPAWDDLRARAERAEAEVKRLREALERCPPNRPQMTGDEFREAVDTWWRLWARPALAVKDEGK